MTLNSSGPSIFDSFNARFLSPRQVASTFVPSAYFDNLTKTVHTLIVGPRGSGKTTLLKMLQGEALEAWKHEKAEYYRANVVFTGVFVPTDRNWSKQIESLSEEYFTQNQKSLLAKAAFTTHVLHKLITAIIFRTHSPEDSFLTPHRRVTLDIGMESVLVKELSSAWYLKPRISSLLSLKHALLAKMAELPALVSAMKHISKNEREDRLASEKNLHLDFLKSAIFAIEIFQDFIGEIEGRWAFLFDELELAPQNIVQELLDSLRSIDDRILFKLSLAPFSPEIDVTKDVLSGTSGNDFELIPLWYANKDDGHPFCLELFKSMLKERNLPEVDPNDIFGRSIFEAPRESRKKVASIYSEYKTLFNRMISKDKSFLHYIQTKSINVNSIENMDDLQRARDLRKIISILKVRDEFRTFKVWQGETKVMKRSRKALSKIYAGATTLFEIVEGNPRWLIGILSPLMDEYKRTNKMIPADKQMAEVTKAIHRFRALLKTIPCPDSTTQPVGIDKIIDLIGDHFNKCVVFEKFNPEPDGSFTVDENISQEFLYSLGKALNAGAIVYVPGTSSELVIKSLINHRFRISYLLAPYYQIPILLMRSVPLNSILKKTNYYEMPLFKV